MSRCYPFPPPGYIRNAPVELELPAKKEKRKHKDKKKKKKKHSATNNDLILQDKDTSLEEIQESGLPNDAIKAERGRSPGVRSAISLAANQDSIQRLQNDKLREEGFSNCVLATTNNAERPKERPHKRKNEGLSNGVLPAKAERLQAGTSRANNGLGTDNKSSKQSLQANSTAEVLTNGMLAMPNKRLKADNSGANLLSNGSSAASSWKRPDEGLQADKLLNEVYSNGVLSTKRKRLQADHHGDKLLPSSSGALGNNCKGSGTSKNEAVLNEVRATSNSRQPADRTGDKFFSKATNSERSQQRLRADSLSVNVVRDGVQATTSIQAGSGNGKELAQHLQASSSRSPTDEVRHQLLANGLECQKLQADNLRVKMPSNHLVGSKGGKSDQNLQQAGTKIAANGVRDTNVRSLLATNPGGEKGFSGGAVLTANCRRAEQISQSDRLAKAAVHNGVATASTKALQAGGVKAGVILPGVRATINEGAEQRLQARDSKHETRVKGVLDAGRSQTDNSQSKMLSNGVAAVTSHDQKLQKEVVSNGDIASSRKGFDVEGVVKSPLAGSATTSGDAAVGKDATSASRVNSGCDDELIRLCRPLARPLSEPPAEDEDWLVSCNTQLQSKARERWDSQIPQVWAEAVLLPSVGIHALPYVVPN